MGTIWVLWPWYIRKYAPLSLYQTPLKQPQWFLIVFYRVMLHPLKSFPGPFWAKLTDVYGVYHAFRRDLHIITYQNHVKYGSVVRQAPNRIVFNTVTALQSKNHHFLSHGIPCNF